MTTRHGRTGCNCPYDLSGDGFIGAGEIVPVDAEYLRRCPALPRQADFNGNGVRRLSRTSVSGTGYQGLHLSRRTEVSATSDDSHRGPGTSKPIHTFEDSLMGSPVFPNSPDTHSGWSRHLSIDPVHQSVRPGCRRSSAVWGDANDPLTVDAPGTDCLKSLHCPTWAMLSPLCSANVAQYRLVLPRLSHDGPCHHGGRSTSIPLQEESDRVKHALYTHSSIPTMDFNAHFWPTGTSSPELLKWEMAGFDMACSRIAPDLPTASSGGEKLLGQFTTLGNRRPTMRSS